MIPIIQELPPKKLIGQHLEMSIAENKTFELWRNFMPRRGEITHAVSKDMFSMQVFPPTFDFRNFDVHARFEKWAAVEVPDFNTIPQGMESFELEGGMYAVFLHKGPASDGPKVFQHIFGTWLPSSGYQLDNRPHFELLGERYKNNEPDSEEEIWIPVKK